MLTSMSEELTPAELSIASVLIWPPRRANSIRPRCVTREIGTFADDLRPDLAALTRIASLARSPTRPWVSLDALM